MSTFTIEPDSIADLFEQDCGRLARRQFVDALWQRRLDVWTTDPHIRRQIGGRLGWLNAIEFIRPQLARLRAFAQDVRRIGVRDVVLLGMGGSSLAPEVLRATLGVSPGFPHFRMLDSVDPAAVRAAMENAASSLFVIASKSGSTIEPNVMAAEARRRVETAGLDWASRAVVITDDGTPLHRLAEAQRFRDVFVNPSDIGGRYSALSFFGIVPAALMGIDLDTFLDRAEQMAMACRMEDPRANPGTALGAFMAAGARSGRDKLTLELPAPLESFGLWVEQLVAESTGKQGKGVVPIAGEPSGIPPGQDRAFVVAQLADANDSDTVSRRRATAGAPSIHLAIPDTLALGAEFLRWEVATATAGFLLDINPFDEPNVQQAKDATRSLLEVYAKERRLPIARPDLEVDGAEVRLSGAARKALGRRSPALSAMFSASDYGALLAYLPPDDSVFAAALRRLREDLGKATGCATMAGYGPRYLHSTGQLQKGGPNTGVFIIVTADVESDLAIPGETYSFGTLEMAQALGDFQSLDRAGRRAVHLHLLRRDPHLLEEVIKSLLK